MHAALLVRSRERVLSASCKRPAEDLTAYLSGELDAEARADIEAHIASCALCRERIERFRTMSSLLLHDGAVPPALQRIQPQPHRLLPPSADAQPTTPPAPEQSRRRGCLRPWAVVLMALLLIGIALGGWALGLL
jgi:anti-sigma factor RsiW